MTFALADANSSSVSTPEACNCARCSSSSAESGGAGAYCAGASEYSSAAVPRLPRAAVMRHRGARRSSHQQPAPS